MNEWQNSLNQAYQESFEWPIGTRVRLREMPDKIGTVAEMTIIPILGLRLTVELDNGQVVKLPGDKLEKMEASE